MNGYVLTTTGAISAVSLKGNGTVTTNDKLSVTNGLVFSKNSITVNGNLSAKYIRMTNDEDNLDVNGNLSITGGDSSTSYLTKGTVYVSGDFTTSTSSYSYNESGTHITVLDGASKQTVTLGKPSSYEKFATLVLVNESEDGVIFESNISVTKLFNHNQNNFTLYNNGSGSTFVDYDGDGLKDNVDPYPTETAIQVDDFVISPVEKQLYLGSEVKPTVIVSYNNKVLELNKDYTISYSDNDKPGTATITITGIDHYINSVTVEFEIYCNHNYDVTRVEPTCTENGSETKVCSICEDVAITEIKDSALGHNFENYIYNNDATCLKNGTSTAKCTRCDEIDTIEVENTATGHNYELYRAVKPTCTTDGYDENVCTLCNQIEKVNIVSAFGHSYIVEKTEATCLNSGYTHYYCEICGDTYNTDYVDATGVHTYVNGFCKYCNAIDIYALPTISAGEIKTVNIENGGEYYYFSFTPETEGTYIFNSNSDTDTYGYLYDSDMNELTSDDDSGKNNNFSIGYNFEAGKTYIFGCRFYSSENTGSFNVSLIENTVSSISYTPINPIEIIENTKGGFRTDDEGNEYYEYSIHFEIGDILTVTNKNGFINNYTYIGWQEDNCSYFEGEDGTLINVDDISFSSDQYFNHWSIGGENYFTVEYMGATVQVPVTIIENPVSSISFTPTKPYEIIENTYGYWNEICNMDENDNIYCVEYWVYYIPYFQNGDILTIIDKDGNSVRYTLISDDSGFDYFISEDGNTINTDDINLYSNQHSNPWSIGGENYFTIEYMGATVQVPVLIIENTHVHQYISETYEPTCINDGYTYFYCEECGDSYSTDYVEATGVHTYVNGFCKYCHTKDNDYTLPAISVGETKTVNIENGGDYCYFSFTPETDGNYIFSSNSDADTYGYLYDSDMNELYSNDDGGNGSNFSIRYDFEAGKTYIFGCRFYSSENIGSFDVSLDENTVKSIEFMPAKPYEIIEDTHCYWDEYWYEDEDGNEQCTTVKLYEIPSYQNGDVLTLTDKDGNSFDYIFDYDKYAFVSKEGNVINADSVNHYSDQYPNNSWSIGGENYFTIEYMGTTVQVPVTIIENPVDSIEYAPVNGFVNAEGITYAPGDGGTWHFRDGYVQSGDKLTVNYKNTGAKEYFAVFNNQGFYEFVTENGEKLDENANFYLDENYGDEWDDVTSISVNCYGKSVELPITTKITIETIEFMPVKPVTIIESNGHEDNRQTWTDDAGNVTYGTNVYWGQDENGETTIESEIFNVGDVINVIYSNGQSASYTYYANRSFEYGYGFIGDDGSVLYVGDIRSNQNEQPWTVGGDNYFTINFSQAATEKIPVTIIKNIDTDTLIAAIEKFNELNLADYSETSYNNLKDVLNRNKELLDTAQSQEEIDFAVTEILEAIYDLEPYLNFTVSAENGSYEVACNGSTSSNSKYSLLFGTEITLSATANEGYKFAGWYDVTNNLYFSKNAEYTFKITSNTNLKAVFVKEQSATLTFTTYSNWVQSTVTKTIDEWNMVTSIDDLLPEVPYKYGYSNGRWIYDNDDVLSKLQAGENVILIPEYDEDDTSLPTPRESEDGVPALDLYYKLDADANVGSFVMAAGIPDDCQIESVGVAFYYKKANEFDPTKFELLINNKMLVSRFNTDEIEDIYIVNMNKLTSTYNWAARGYVTYYDVDGNLKTAYSNQVNIVDREQV